MLKNLLANDKRLEKKTVSAGKMKRHSETPNSFSSLDHPHPMQDSKFINFSPSRCLGLVFTATAHPVSPDSEHSIGTYVLQDAHIASTTSDYPLVV